MTGATLSHLDVAVEAARAAARVAVDYWRTPLAITAKGYRDVVTEADFAAQDAAVRVIQSRFPAAAILGEENLTPAGEAETLWVIDPIDGTSNYSRHVPIYCVSVGVVQGERPVAGAVYDPLRDYLFTAERGLGAQLNGSSIHVSQVNDLGEAILGVDWGREPAVRARSLAWLGRLAAECRTVRAIGSAALAMCYLAAGWIDLYFNFSLKPWDGAATQLIIEEAGGRLTTPLGEAWDYTQPSVVASNGRLHAVLQSPGVNE